MRAAPRVLLSLTSLALLFGCGAESDRIVYGIQAHSFANSEWSEPVNIGSVVNSSALENNPALSPDGLSLYFVSDRPGGFGSTDIWVARRGCDDCPWTAPVNLGPSMNGAGADGGTSFSHDGHLLFFHADRPGGFGNTDIYVSRRTNTHGDFAWEPLLNLGPDVNTANAEAGVERAQVAEDGGNVYFNRSGPGPAFLSDLYVVSVARTGETRGPAVPASELNDPSANEAAPAIRSDGKEIYFHSNRAGTLGLTDLWVSRRQSVNDAWSTPANMGAPMNSTSQDQQPNLSHDGRTLFFTSNRPGGSGGNDIWMATRTPSGN
jgi:Tol biopolymer transport system component